MELRTLLITLHQINNRRKAAVVNLFLEQILPFLKNCNLLKLSTLDEVRGVELASAETYK
jgi:hypothetical protein